MNDEIEAGWTQAALSGGMHLRRIVEMYQELDFEVHLEEIRPEECAECTACYRKSDEKIYRVYTRPKQRLDSK